MGVAMRRITMFLLGFGVLLTSGLAQAQPTGGSVRVQVNGHREAQGANPGTPPGTAAATNTRTVSGIGTDLSAGGRADIGNLPDGTYLVTVRSGDRVGTTYVRVEAGKTSEAVLSAGGLPSASAFAGGPGELLSAAKAAAEICSRSGYDAAVNQLDRSISMLEINLRDLNRIIDEYAKLSNLAPDLQLLRTTSDIITRSAMGGGGAGRTAVRGNVPTNPGLQYLPAYISALEEKAKLEARLKEWRDARQAVPPFPSEKCAREVEKLQQQVALQFLISPELALIFANRPQFALFRLELAGVITKLGAFKPDDTDAGTKVGMSAGIRWDSSFLGTKQLGIETKLWYVDYNMKSSGDVAAEPGGTIGLFSPATSGNPFGGYFTAGPLTNGWYNADVQSYGGEVQVQTWIGSGNFRAMPWFGMRVGRTTVKEDVSFDIGAPVFTTFEQKNDIKDTYIGPTIGLKGRVDIGGGLYAFGEGSLAVEYHRGKGNWQTFVPVADAMDGPRKDSLSSSKWGISAGIKAGLGLEVGGFGLQFGAGMSYTNASPYLEYKEADSTTTGTGGADIGYGTQKDYFLEVRGTVKF